MLPSMAVNTDEVLQTSTAPSAQNTWRTLITRLARNLRQFGMRLRIMLARFEIPAASLELRDVFSELLEIDELTG